MSPDDYTLHVEDRPQPADVRALVAGLDAHGLPHTGPNPGLELGIFLRDEGHVIAAGLYAGIWSGWLDVKYLWVRGDLRGRGWGRRILQAAEQEAIARRCRHARLDTMSYQARGFYEKLGYRVFAELEDYPGPHKRMFLRKDLV